MGAAHASPFCQNCLCETCIIGFIQIDISFAMQCESVNAHSRLNELLNYVGIGNDL